MHILLVNDDGIQSIGIRALCEAARARGHRVSICAPSAQQSAASQRITLMDPIYVKPYDFGYPDVNAYAITGTPADCVRLGLFELVTEPVDVLISGINDGFNAGMAVHYSGTVGAATEAALNRVRAMAVSTHHRASRATYAYTANIAIAAAEGYLALAVPLSVANFKDSYIRRESPRAGVYYWMSNEYSMEPPEAGSDLYWLDQGHVTVTFMGNPCEHGTEHTAFVQNLTGAAQA